LLVVTGTPALRAGETLSAAEVQLIVDQASTWAATVSPDSLIAVVDREGNVLTVWDTAPGTVPTSAEIGEVISRAGVACFLNSNQNALTSRTAGFIVQPNFPPGFTNRINGPLIGVNNSHYPWSDINRFRQQPFPAVPANPAVAPGLGGVIPNTSLSGFPGGVPLYQNGVLVGGVGVFGDGDDTITPGSIASADTDEEVALAGQIGFEPPVAIRAPRIFFDGISLPYVKSPVPTLGALAPIGAALAGFPVLASPLPAAYPDVPIYPTDTFAGVTGELRNPIVAPTNAGGLPNPLTTADVRNVIEAAVQRALITRSRIRIPRGSPAAIYVAVVSNENGDLPVDNNLPPEVLGVFRMPDTVTRSWDISVQKARTVVYFSNEEFAFSTRSVGWLSQQFYPPGINNTASGPWFGFQANFFDRSAGSSGNVYLPNGITIFAGGQPLYKGGKLVGAVGISGDGIDEDDIIAAAGASAFAADGSGRMSAPSAIRADKYIYKGARLPFAKFPRNPVR
jgi:uncharacterized protein GlcG (DUF336 family)